MFGVTYRKAIYSCHQDHNTTFEVSTVPPENIHQHLEILSSLKPCDLTDLKFYTVGVTALFTNVNVETSINDVIEFAKEYWDQIDTYGLRLVDLHLILETVLSNSFFTFNNRLYRQVFRAFIGSSISPPVAIIRVHAMEKRSIYTDLQITTGIQLYYKRYVDDIWIAKSKDETVSEHRRKTRTKGSCDYNNIYYAIIIIYII